MSGKYIASLICFRNIYMKLFFIIEIFARIATELISTNFSRAKYLIKYITKFSRKNLLWYYKMYSHTAIQNIMSICSYSSLCLTGTKGWKQIENRTIQCLELEISIYCYNPGVSVIFRIMKTQFSGRHNIYYGKILQSTKIYRNQ